MTILAEPEVSVARSERLARLRTVVEGMARRMRPADEDMLAAGMAKLWELLREDYRPSNRYLIAAARNAMIDHCRHLNVRRREQRLEEVCGLDEPIARALSVETDIEDLLALLPRRMRLAFDLHCLRSYTLAECARKLHMSVRTVARLIAIARERLREQLA